MPKTKVPRTLISLNLSKSALALIAFTKSVIQSMTGNAYFPNPQPPLATVQTALDELMSAEAAATKRALGAVATRNEKRTVLVALLEELRVSVQKVADANPEQAPSVINSAGMPVRKPAVRKPRVFSAVQGAVSGTVKLIVPSAGHRSSYDWQWSSDGGKTWQLLPSTIQARTTVTGLPPATNASFRYRAVTKTGVADWSEVISLLVK